MTLLNMNADVGAWPGLAPKHATCILHDCGGGARRGRSSAFQPKLVPNDRRRSQQNEVALAPSEFSVEAW